MQVPREPKFHPDNEMSIEPEATSQARSITKKVINKNPSLIEHAKNCLPHVNEDEFMRLFSCLMNIFNHQSEYKCISVSQPSPDLVCEVALHNTIPTLLTDGRYFSGGYAIYDYCTGLPAVDWSFIGMVATGKGAVFGDPNDPMNDPVRPDVQRARQPKASLKKQQQR